MFVIRNVYGDGTVMHLRGTVWTWMPDRATRYATRELAQAALETSERFYAKKVSKNAEIIEIPDVQ